MVWRRWERDRWWIGAVQLLLVLVLLFTHVKRMER
jgi:hypothetical protein